MEYALDVQNLDKIYNASQSDPVHALNNVSFSIAPGEIFGLLGPNGAGKTSLISILSSLEKATDGSAKIFGTDIATQTQLAKTKIGVVSQEVVNHGFFNLIEILTFHSGYYGIWNNKERIEELLHGLDLWEHRKKMVKQLSGGMKRRLMIAKALVHRPRLLLLDEPTAGVDVELRTRLWVFVRQLQKEGTTVLLTTHYLTEAEELCGRVGILSRGVLQYLGPTRGVIEKLTLRTIEITLKNNVAIRPGQLSILEQRDKYVKVAAPHGGSLGDILQQLQIPMDEIQDVRTHEGSLEEAFLSVVNQGSPQ